MKPKMIVVVLVIVMALIILSQNTQVVTVHVLFWDLSMSRIILIPFLLLVGFIIGFFIGKNSWDW
ncbi:MAG TPA: DUF1049 domain-containing protein [Candidatus Omnitrophica bacterium]|nr:MAG: hypothetical protein A2Z81_09635 [Omnitrophica WOR_2 bacterium GWA2_45_18]OGX19047.1 MAG: hypothetical protein A2Y04_02230 [Omnitrophica WOR_2 bacterium GWC2_45_7]HBR14005.1 DUF1049 domain-containing protein [Candidatus Omnitrophota bacterium]